jgi:integrase
MPLKLIAPNLKRRCPFYTVRGTHLGIHLDRSTKTPSRSIAAGLLRAWRQDIERQAISRPGEPTFLDAAVRYMAAHGEQRFLQPIVESIGRMALASIDQATIETLALRLYPKASPATLNRQVYTPVSAVLKHVKVEWELKRPKGWRGTLRTNWLREDEAFAALEAAANVDAEFGIFLTLLLYTGLRLGEALALTTQQIELAESFAYVPQTKNEEPRGVFLPPAVVAALASHPRGMERQGRVFRFRKNGRLYELLRRTEKASGVELTFHLFRHTWATWMRRYAGLDTAGLVATKAWKDPASARRYEHVIASEESRKAALLPVPTRGLGVYKKRKGTGNAA